MRRNEVIESQLVQVCTLWFNICCSILSCASHKLADYRAVACARKRIGSESKWEDKLAAIFERMGVVGASFSKVETGWVGRDVIEFARERRDAHLISPWRAPV